MIRLAWRLALRDLRGGLGGLLIVLLCLGVGVASVAGIFSLRAALDQGIAESGRAILGGDLEISSGLGPISPAMVSWFTGRGAKVSQTVDTRSILVAPSGRRLLAAVKAVGPGWPLLGQVTSRPAGKFAMLAREPGLLLAPEAAQTLGLHPGDPVTLGGVKLQFLGSILDAPDSIGDSQLFGAKCFVAAAALEGSALVQPDALVTFNLQVLLPPAMSASIAGAQFRKAFPNADFQLRDRNGAAPDLTRFIDQAALFMTLLGLAALLVGGIGVANGVEAWLTARARTIATLRCLGASARLVGLMQGMQLSVLGLPGILLGLVAGAAAPLLVLPLLRHKLPLPAHIGLYPRALLISAIFGLLVGFVAAFRPLRRATAISGAALFRPAGLPARIGFSAAATAVQTVAGLMLLGLAIWVVPSFYIALGFCAGTVLTLALLRGIAALLMWLLPRLPRPRDAALAFGLRRLSGPASSLPLMLLSAGAGLTVLVGVAEIRGNLVGEFTGALPAAAPSLFFIDLQPADLPQFETVLARARVAHDLQTMPSLRARIIAIDGVPEEKFHPKSANSGWPLGTDIGFSYAASPPPGTRLSAGSWWAADYLGPPLLSFDAGIAKDWGLKLGDSLTVNVLGRRFDLKIANLRKIDWQSLRLNFLMLGTPNPFAGAPHTLVATVRVDPGQEGFVLTAVSDAFPGVTAIDIGAVLRALGRVLGEVGTAVSLVGLIALLSGALVLISAIAAERQSRIAEAVVLKTLGASTAQIRRAWIAEFAVAGGAAGISAALLGTLAAFITVRQVFHLDWHFQPGIMLATLLGSIALMLVLGFMTTSRILRLPAAPQLRLGNGV